MLGPSELYQSPAQPGDLESAEVPMRCRWVIYTFFTGTFSSFNPVLITSRVLRSLSVLHSACWVLVLRLLVSFAQNESSCGEIPRITREKKKKKKHNLFFLAYNSLFLPQPHPAGILCLAVCSSHTTALWYGLGVCLESWLWALQGILWRCESCQMSTSLTPSFPHIILVAIPNLGCMNLV